VKWHKPTIKAWPSVSKRVRGTACSAEWREDADHRVHGYRGQEEGAKGIPVQGLLGGHLRFLRWAAPAHSITDDFVPSPSLAPRLLAGGPRFRMAIKPCPLLNTAALDMNASMLTHTPSAFGRAGQSSIPSSAHSFFSKNQPCAERKQPFRYLVVVDLEATCDYCPEPLVDASVNSEIIEFPWVCPPTASSSQISHLGATPQVVLDTNTLEVIHEERYFVRPDYLLGVTPYCSALTGATLTQRRAEQRELHCAFLSSSLPPTPTHRHLAGDGRPKHEA